MSVQINITENVVVAAVQGKLMGGPDTQACHNKMKRLIAEGHQQIVIDLSGVEWVNSSGLGMLVACYTSCRNAGGHFKIAGPTEKTKSLLKMTKLITVMESFENTEQAIRSFRN